MSLSVEEERELALLSQRAQSGILELLQDATRRPCAVHDGLLAAQRLVDWLERLSKPTSELTKAMIPDDNFRKLFQKRLERTNPAIPAREEQLAEARNALLRLLADERLDRVELIRLLHFVRDVPTLRVMVRLPTRITA